MTLFHFQNDKYTREFFLFSTCCHSKKPFTGTIHLFDLNGSENEGFLSMLSALALKVLYLITLASSKVFSP